MKLPADFVRIGRDGNTVTFKLMKTGTILLYSVDNCKQTISEITMLQTFKYSVCTFGASVRETAGVGSCYIPELKGLKHSTQN